MPPETGEGMQNFCNHAILRVINMPSSKAIAPIPALWSISSVIICTIFVFCLVLVFLFILKCIFLFLFDYKINKMLAKCEKQRLVSSLFIHN